MKAPTLDTVKDRLRLVLLLDACEAADLTPIPLMRFHALAFLANVLSPVWSIESYDGKILKRKEGPFYPELQRELDLLVGLGLVSICNVGTHADNGVNRLHGAFSLNSQRCEDLLSTASTFHSESTLRTFFRRLTFASSRLRAQLESVVGSDATWSDPRTGTGDIVDFSEWSRANYSAYAALAFDSVAKAPKSSIANKLQLYLRFLEKKALHDS